MGPGSGVEFLKNEPYVNGPKGSSGQYTYKIYHVEKHIPGDISVLFWHKYLLTIN